MRLLAEAVVLVLAGQHTFHFRECSPRFPMVNYDEPGQFEFLEDDDNPAIYEYFEPDTGELMLGDIVISSEKVYSQAEEYGHSVKRELGFLVAHSMLHLFGYDHMEEDERVVMEAKQSEILDRLGITRD